MKRLYVKYIKRCECNAVLKTDILPSQQKKIIDKYYIVWYKAVNDGIGCRFCRAK